MSPWRGRGSSCKNARASGWQQREAEMQDGHLLALLEAHLENRLTPAEAEELRLQLRSSPAVRQQFWEYVEQHALIEDVLSEGRGRDLALHQTGEALRFDSGDSPPSGRWRRRAWVGA